MASDVPADRIDAAFDRFAAWAADAAPPGASVAFTDGDGLLRAGGIGDRDRDAGAPATPDTRFAVGSVTKPFTALAVLRLDERGRVDVSDPVAEYVPYFEDAPGDPVTVRELLSHTAGMPDDGLAFVAGDLDGWAAFQSFHAGTTDRRIELDRCLYYNSGYAALARLVETVSGRAFPAFVADEILDSLGMDRSTFDADVLDEGTDAMTPYASGDGGVRPEPVSENPTAGSPLLAGPGGLVASVADLTSFLRAHVAGSRVAGVPTERTREAVGTMERFVDGTEYAYGYGWEVRPFGTDTLVCHGGNTGYSAAFAGYLVDSGLGVAAACNAPADVGSAATDALAVLDGRDPGAVDPARAAERAVDALTGRYESVAGTGHATVERDDAHLVVEFGGAVDPFTVRALPTDLSGDRYRFTGLDRVESTTDLVFFSAEAPAFLFEGQLLRRVGPVGDGESEA
jgi:CubicO group peptidase (beta-lactamase class C family)